MSVLVKYGVVISIGRLGVLVYVFVMWLRNCVWMM